MTTEYAMEKGGLLKTPLSSLDEGEAMRQIEKLARELSGEDRVVLGSYRMRIRQDERIPILQKARERSDAQGLSKLSEYIERETRKLSEAGREQTVFVPGIVRPGQEKPNEKRSPEKIGEEGKDYIKSGPVYYSYMAVRSYPSATTKRGLLESLTALSGVGFKIFVQRMDPRDTRTYLQHAARAAAWKKGDDRVSERVGGDVRMENLLRMAEQDARDGKGFCRASVYLYAFAKDPEKLQSIREKIFGTAAEAGISMDPLLFLQRKARASVLSDKDLLSSRTSVCMPYLSLANLYPAGTRQKTDPKGLYVGQIEDGGPVYLDLMRRTEQITNGNVLILGNSGEGKSNLLKQLLADLYLSGTRVYSLDPEGEYGRMCETLGGTRLEMGTGNNRINPFDVRLTPQGPEDETECDKDLLQRHLSFLKEFFRVGRGMGGGDLDALEMVLVSLYEKFGWGRKDGPEKPRTPVMTDLDRYLGELYEKEDTLYGRDVLQRLRVSVSPMVTGAQSASFNGETRLASSDFMTFDVRHLNHADKGFRDAMLYNILSYISGELLLRGNAAVSVDELYLFLSNPYAMETVRNLCKRARKRDSCVLLCSQNPEDFLQPGIREMTKPLFSIPSHRFIFYGGVTDVRNYKELLNLSDRAYARVSGPHRGLCLYRCADTDYVLHTQKTAEIFS